MKKHLNENTMAAIFITGFFALSILFAHIFTSVFRPELIDKNMDFQSQLVKNGQIEVEIQKLDKYNNGKAGTSYYIFTDKGRLVVNPKVFTFDSTLYEEFQQHKNETCLVNVEEDLINDWEVKSIISCE